MNKIKTIIFFLIFYSSSIYLSAQPDKSFAIKLYNKALAFEKAGENDSAIYYYHKGLAINKELYGEKHPIVAMTYGIIGDFYSSIKNFDLAIEYHQKSLTQFIELMGEKNEKVASEYISIGFVYISKGDYASALQSFKNASTIYKETFGETHASITYCYNIIAEIYFIIREYDLALEYYQNDLIISKQILTENHPDLAAIYNHLGFVYEAKGEFDLALENYQKELSINKVLYGDNHQNIAVIYKNIGKVFNSKGEYEISLQYFQKSLIINKIIFGENSTNVAELYSVIGANYMTCGSIELAQQYYQKALAINKETYGENNFKMADIYNNLGQLYSLIGDYDNAFQYFQKALIVLKTVVDENHPDLANLYNNLGLIFYHKNEFDLALEYFQKALFVHKKYFSENHPSVSMYYNNIGLIYKDRGVNNLALEYLEKACKINENLAGRNQIDLANAYTNIGLIYKNMGDYNLALDYLNESTIIIKSKFGESHPSLAKNYNNIGFIYKDKGDNNSALDFFQRALSVNKKIYGEKHPEVARNYNNIASIFALRNENNISLNYYHKGLIANLKDFNDSLNMKSIPIISNLWDPFILLNSLYGKSQAFYNLEDLKTSFINLQLADILVTQLRKTSSLQTDKIALAETAYLIYDWVMLLCLEMSINPTSPYTKESLYEQSFSYSESSKAAVLLEALAGQESLKFAGIPDSLLQKEHNLKVNISFYEKNLSESSGSLNEINWRDKLFSLTQIYYELIRKFEINFPDYYNLKYATKIPTVPEIQNLLDNKTAIRSYFLGGNNIFIFTLTKNNLDVQLIPKLTHLNDSITLFRYGLTKTSQRMQGNYLRLGYTLYKQLFPESAPIDEQIENLIIIPDGILAIVPFESLLTTSYSGNIDAYSEYPFLIKKFNISYSYSVNLFYRTFSKQKLPSIEITKLNDWLAFAPVFDNIGDQTMVISTRELQKQLNWLKTDSLMTNRSMFDRSYITPLPATKTEAEAIFKLYDENNLKAKVLLHNSANEKFIKSGELEQYKVLHFATHGFVNSERPELSGLLLAQDTTSSEDGVLYSGEIYNLKLNAELVVLSACETGLGKIQKGEGILGLTRALLYAGAKNIIVSLWQVEDESTADLMVDFYKNSLENKGKISYSEALRNAKLKMISEGKYAHPLFWSPFILIGN